MRFTREFMVRNEAARAILFMDNEDYKIREKPEIMSEEEATANLSVSGLNVVR